MERIMDASKAFDLGGLGGILGGYTDKDARRV